MKQLLKKLSGLTLTTALVFTMLNAVPYNLAFAATASPSENITPESSSTQAITEGGMLIDVPATIEYYYILPLGSEYILVDTVGNELLRAENLEYFPQYGTTAIGGEFIVATRSSETGASVSSQKALYNINGTLLLDYGDYVYINAFGDVALRFSASEKETQDTEDVSELVNIHTGEVILSGSIAHATIISENMAVLYAEEGFVHSIVDFDGNVIVTSPVEGETLLQFNKYGIYYYAQIAGPYGTFVVLDENLGRVGDDIYAAQLKPATVGYPYLITVDYSGNANAVVNITTTRIVLTIDTPLVDYYGSCYTALASDDMDDVELYKIDGTLLATFDKDTFVYLPATEETPMCFYYADEQTGNIVCMNEAGEILLQKQVEGEVVAIEMCGKNLLQIITQNENEANTINALLLNLELESVITTERTYTSFAENQRDTGIISAFYITEDERPTNDLFNANGTLIMEDITAEYGYRGGLIIVEQENFVGLIDLSGNWVYKVEKGELVQLLKNYHEKLLTLE